eukprot:ctg_544.g307
MSPATRRAGVAVASEKENFGVHDNDSSDDEFREVCDTLDAATAPPAHPPEKSPQIGLPMKVTKKVSVRRCDASQTGFAGLPPEWERALIGAGITRRDVLEHPQVVRDIFQFHAGGRRRDSSSTKPGDAAATPPRLPRKYALRLSGRCPSIHESDPSEMYAGLKKPAAHRGGQTRAGAQPQRDGGAGARDLHDAQHPSPQYCASARVVPVPGSVLDRHGVYGRRRPHRLAVRSGGPSRIAHRGTDCLHLWRGAQGSRTGAQSATHSPRRQIRQLPLVVRYWRHQTGRLWLLRPADRGARQAHHLRRHAVLDGARAHPQPRVRRQGGRVEPRHSGHRVCRRRAALDM